MTGVQSCQPEAAPVRQHTPTPWTFRDVSGAGLEIYAPVYQMTGVDLPRGMPEAPIHVFQFTAPQIVQIAAERWVQFEPTGWSEMQAANAAFIVEAVNNHATLQARVEELTKALEWQPIGTAPRDQNILLWWKHGSVGIGSWEHDEHWRSRKWAHKAMEEGWRCEGDGCIPINQIDCTHWMPLPRGPVVPLEDRK